MRQPSTPFGVFLRSLRASRHMTLQQVKERSGLSASVLSRLEHAEQTITRAQCEALSRAYQLSAYETFMLYSNAGFLPTMQPPGTLEAVRAEGIKLLGEVHFPGLLMDRLGNVHAWNQAQDAIWKPPRHRPVHVIDDLFSDAARARLGAQWRAYAGRSLWIFLQRSLGLASVDAFRETLERLEAAHGEEFVRILEEAREAAHPSALEMAQMAVALDHHTPFGHVRYVVSQVLLHTNTQLEVYFHLPLGADSLSRFLQWVVTLGENRVYEAAAPVRA